MADHTHCHHGPVAELPRLRERLRERSHRITGPREAILDVMRRHPHPLLIKEIHAMLDTSHATGATPASDARGCDLATVYRSMKLLQKMGMVKRVDFGRGAARFELLAEGDDGHHHHLVCNRCERVMPLEECLLDEVEKAIARRSGFKGITHRLEFFGLCPGCQ